MLPGTTCCIAARQYGGPEQLTRLERPMPVPAAHQALVEVAFSPVNPADIVLRSGALKAAISGPPPYVGGLELSGVIAAVGPGSRWQVGNRVAAITTFIPSGMGSHCRHVVVDDESVASVPDGYDLARAAALPMSGLTAQIALDRALTAGRCIAISGAVGAVGSLALRLAIEEGIDPIAIVRRSQIYRARALGATRIVAAEDGARAVRTLAGAGAGAGVDAVIDAAVLGAAILPALRDGGRFIAVKATPFAPDRRIVVERVSVRDYQREQAKLARLLTLAGQGRLAVSIAVTLPADAAAQAHRLVEQGGQGGRVMLDFGIGTGPRDAFRAG